MKRILLSTNYPNLYGLGIFNIEKKTASRIFTKENSLIHLFQNQIFSLVIDIDKRKNSTLSEDNNAHIFTRILTVSSKLRLLNFGPSLFRYQRLSFRNSIPTVISSTLLELRVSVDMFLDCLYLLDGRFDQLRKFDVDIYRIDMSHKIIDNKKNLVNLKHFSLNCKWETNEYNELILPLLHRMSNLEELDLCLAIHCENKFLDGYNLKQNYQSFITIKDIQLSFQDFHDHKVISYVDYFSNRKKGQCQIYSFPYHGKYFDYVTNNLPNVICQYVHEVLLFDERPFEHEFFLRIAKSFPMMKSLNIINKQPQKNKFSQQSKDDDIIQYPHLTQLHLDEAHDDYVEQFLLDTKTCLLTTLDLEVNYEVLDTVTHHFTREATRINCAKLLNICIPSAISIPMHLKNYFPHTELLYESDY